MDGRGSYCLVGVEFQICKMKSYENLFHNNVNILYITKLHLKMLKMIYFNFSCHNKKEQSKSSYEMNL